MTIFEKKKLERDTFRKLRDEISFDQMENVEKNVKIYVDSFLKEHKNIGYIAIYWPLKNEVDIRSLKEKIPLALPRCKEKKSYYFIHGMKILLLKILKGYQVQITHSH